MICMCCHFFNICIALKLYLVLSRSVRFFRQSSSVAFPWLRKTANYIFMIEPVLISFACTATCMYACMWCDAMRCGVIWCKAMYVCIYASMYVCMYVCMYLSIYLTIHAYHYLSTYLSVCLPTYLSTYLPTCRPTDLLTYRPTYVWKYT